MIQSNFMEKLLDGVQVEWKVLGDVINSLKTGLNPRKNFQLNTPNAEGFSVTVREIQNGKIIFNKECDNDDSTIQPIAYNSLFREEYAYDLSFE